MNNIVESNPILSILSIIVAILILCFLIIIHELGHFTVGRILGFQIDEFAVGFGPKLFGRKSKKGTQFSLRAIPLGGYCKFVGEDEEGRNPQSFNSQPAWKRFLVLLSGSAMNLLFAFLATIVIFVAVGDFLPKIDSVSPGMPAYEAGIMVDDVILSIDGKEAASQQIFKLLKNANQTGIELKVLRDGKQETIFVSNIYNEAQQRNVLGITMVASEMRVKISMLTAIGRAGPALVNISKQMLQIIGSLFINPATITNNMSGIVGTVNEVGKQVQSGFETTMTAAVIVSLNLGLVNLLPFPALDGSKLLFILIEMIVRKPVPRKIEAAIHFVGFALLFMLMIYMIFSDVSKMIG